MRDNLTTGAEVAGAISITTGLGLMWPPLALVAAGVFLIVGGYLGADT